MPRAAPEAPGRRRARAGASDQPGTSYRVSHIAADRAGVHLGQRVVQRLAVAQRLVDRRIEAVQDAQLELVRALEEVLEVGEREHDVRDAGTRLSAGGACGLSSRAPRRLTYFEARMSSQNSERFWRAGCPVGAQVRCRNFWPRHGDVEEPPLVLDRALEARLPLTPRAGHQVPDVPAPGPLRGTGS
jgi:hypothetical protein